MKVQHWQNNSCLSPLLDFSVLIKTKMIFEQTNDITSVINYSGLPQALYLGLVFTLCAAHIFAYYKHISEQQLCYVHHRMCKLTLWQRKIVRRKSYRGIERILILQSRSQSEVCRT